MIASQGAHMCIYVLKPEMHADIDACYSACQRIVFATDAGERDVKVPTMF